MKKTTLGILALVILLIVFLPACKKSVFDITGTWNIYIVYAGTYEYNCTITFAGSETSGVASCTCSPNTGTGLYTVTDGKTIKFTITWTNAGYVDDFTGTKSSDSVISGTLIENPGNTPGVWTASR